VGAPSFITVNLDQTEVEEKASVFTNIKSHLFPIVNSSLKIPHSDKFASNFADSNVHGT
jgi:acetylglutamate synthase